MDSLKVVPLLLEERSKEVETHGDVLSELLLSHFFVTDSDVKVGNFLELPLNGSSGIVDLLLDWLSVRDWLREHTNSRKNWTENGWDFLDESISDKEEGISLGPLLDLFLVLVEFLQVVHGGDIETGDLGSGGLILMLLIGNDAHFHVWSWDVWKSDGTGETLIFLWIVILKSNLKFDGLGELSSLGFLLHFLEALDDERV